MSIPSFPAPRRPARAFLTLCAALLALFPAAGLSGQILRGRIMGLGGEPVPSALVRLTTAADTAQAWTRSNDAGEYQIAFPAGPGPWLLTVQRLGYESSRVTCVPTSSVQDVTLAPRATLLDALQVRGSRTAVRALPGGQGGNASSRRASTLEWSTVTPGDLGEAALLAQGTVPLEAGGSGMPGVSIAGQGPEGNRVTADGASFGGGSLPSEGVKSVGVVTETYDVARGQFTGGHIAAVTHSGTQDAGGSLRVRFLGKPADAFERPDRSAPEGLFGLVSGAYGGPLVRDRLFAFGAAQWSSQTWDFRSLASSSPDALRRRGVDTASVRRFDQLVADAGFHRPAAERTQQFHATSALLRLDWKPAEGHAVGLRLDGRTSAQPLPASALNVSGVGATRRAEDAGVLASLVSRRGAVENDLRVYAARGGSRSSPERELPAGQVGGGGGGLGALSFGSGAQSRARSRHTLREVSEALRWTVAGGAQRLQAGATYSVERAELRGGPEPFGTYVFEDLEALEEGRPAWYSRRLDARSGAAETRYAAAFAGHTWQVTPVLGLTYGVRMERFGHGDRPAYDPAVAAAYPELEGGIPSRHLVSPRFGFHWLVPHRSGNPRVTLRGGAGRFVGRVPLEALAFAAGETGAADRTLVCLGDAVPVPDWASLIGHPDQAPRDCVGGGGTSSLVPAVSAFAPDFSPPRVWRGSLSGAWQPIARFSVSLGGMVSRGEGLTTARDLNLPDAPSFTLGAEGGRGFFVPAAAIDARTGLVPPLAGRPHDALGIVRRIGSDARSGTAQVTGSLMWVPRGVFRILVLNYTHTRQWDEASALDAPGGALPVAGVDPRGLLRGTGDWERRHAFQLSYGGPFLGSGRVSLLARLTSGAPYTPMVRGDVNGDGAANDAAFVFAPSDAGAGVAEGMEALLRTAPSHARACLRRQLGRLAERNSCRGPWTATLDAQVQLPLPRKLDRRLQVSVNAANLPSLADWLAHGGGGLRGWGRSTLPDRDLLRVRGFDAAAGAFRYEVNPAFGQPMQRPGGLFASFSLTLQARLRVGTDPAEQWIVADVRREQSYARPREQLRAAVGQRAPNLPLRLIATGDSLGLGLTQAQVHDLTLLADSVQLVLPPLLDSLASAAHLADTATQASSPARFRLRAYTGIVGALLDDVRGQVRAILGDEQWARLPQPWRDPAGRAPIVPMKPIVIASDDVW